MNIRHSITIFTLSSIIMGCVAMPTIGPETSPSSIGTLSSGKTEGAELADIVDRYFEERLELDPIQATEIGDYRYNDRFPIEISDDHRNLERAMYERYLREIEQIVPTSLSGQDLLTREVFDRSLRSELEALQYQSNLMPVNQFSSTVQQFAQLGSGTSIHPFKTPKDYDDFLSRANGFVSWVDVAIRNMREGMKLGIVQPRVLIEKTLRQIQSLITHDTVESSIFYGPINQMPEGFAEAEKTRLQSAYTRAIEETIDPAYRRLHTFLKDEYLTAARTTHGRGQLPGGGDWYSFLVRRYTTTPLSPDEIHQIGLAEVARIHGEMEKVKRQVGFKGTLKKFFAHIRENPKLRYSSRQQIVDSFVGVKQRVDRLTPKLFASIPAADYEVRPVEEFREASAAGGSYQPATPDGVRPGVFYVNTFNPTERTTPGMEALSLHEGAPGHHFQISVQNELTGLPRFRRFGFFTAYVEGWGLYAETLGKELGVYTDPYQYFGSLSSELWRAIRLVLDTGIHSKGWTREQAIAYALENSGNTAQGVTSEVERFMAIPGQALAYKIGQIEITRLRRLAERELGDRFDIKEFHNVILQDGALPLDVLARKTEAWIASRKNS